MIDKTELLESYALFTFKGWDTLIKERGIDFKYPEQLNEAIRCYERKIPLLNDLLLKIACAKVRPDLFPEIDVGSEQILIEKVARLKEKCACILKEQEFRKDDKVKRALHSTVYYIDLTNGLDTNNGLATTTPWKTIGKYANVAVRSPGDIAWVRANTTQVFTALCVFDEDGTINNYIEIRGCSSATGEDPWGDASDVKPILNFNGGNFYLSLSGDDYWRLYRLEVRNSLYYLGAFINDHALGTILDACWIHANTAKGVRCFESLGMLVKGCAFNDNNTDNLFFSFSSGRVQNSTFDGGGTNSTDYGLVIDDSIVECSDCKFGDIATHDLADIYAVPYLNRTYLRNCKLASTTDVAFAAGVQFGNYVTSEDHDQVKGAQKGYYYIGIVERDSIIQLDSLDSAKMSPNSNCGSWQALSLSNDPLNGDYQLWCPASQKTITIKARETAAWTADPTNTGFYFEASYLNAASGGARSAIASTQALSGITEVSFTMTFTPAQAGWVYVTCYLKKYEAGKSVSVSVKPTVS